MMKNCLFNYKHAQVPFSQINYFHIPVTCFPNNVAGMEEFNKVYKQVLEMKMNTMKRTRSGGICVSRKNKRNNIYSYSVKERQNGAGIEMLVVAYGCCWRFQWRQTKDHLGHFNFRRFLQMCQTHNIHIQKYAVKNGLAIKKTITPAPIKLERNIYENHWFRNGNIHHIDLHSSYPAGLSQAYPEFKPLVEELYSKRKVKDEYKDLLNHSIGFFQSKSVNYKYANLAKSAIDYNNKRIAELAKLIKKNRGSIILYNTDGIWYRGPIFDSKDRGNKLGQWDYDYKNVKEFHVKSVGCFEFIDENGNYVSKARGIQKELLHQMGDIDVVHGIRKFWFDKERGIVYEN